MEAWEVVTTAILYLRKITKMHSGEKTAYSMKYAGESEHENKEELH